MRMLQYTVSASHGFVPQTKGTTVLKCPSVCTGHKMRQSRRALLFVVPEEVGFY